MACQWWALWKKNKSWLGNKMLGREKRAVLSRMVREVLTEESLDKDLKKAVPWGYLGEECSEQSKRKSPMPGLLWNGRGATVHMAGPCPLSAELQTREVGPAICVFTTPQVIPMSTSFRNTALNDVQSVWEPWAKEWHDLIYLLASVLEILCKKSKSGPGLTSQQAVEMIHGRDDSLGPSWWRWEGFAITDSQRLFSRGIVFFGAGSHGFTRKSHREDAQMREFTLCRAPGYFVRKFRHTLTSRNYSAHFSICAT